MLRFMVFCVAMGLASARKIPQPLFNDVYSVKIVVYRHPYYPYTVNVWYDAHNNKSRADFYGTEQQVISMGTTRDFKYGVVTAIKPVTTENQRNTPLCYNVTGTQDAPMRLIQYLKPMDELYFFVKKEIVNGVDAEMWQIKIMQDNYTFENTWWVTYKELHGVKQTIPVKFVNLRHNNVRGIRQYYFEYDFYSYDTAPIDPAIFNISRAFTCHSVKPKKVQHLLKGLSGLNYGAFENFKQAHGKQYTSQEEHEIRLNIFKKNLKLIDAHNRGNHGYKMAVNHLVDRTEDELANMFGRLPSDTLSGALPFPYTDNEIEELSKDLPKRFDWRLHGGVMHVKDQLDCGSSWAFGAVGVTETAFFILRNNSKVNILKLSEQALIDCSWGFGNKGCDGGREESAFDWIKKHGLPTHEAYGGVYKGMEGKCNMDLVRKRIKISGYVKVKPDVKALKLAIVKHGSVSASMHANANFFMYSGGVYSDHYCSHRPPNHVVLVVGWDVLDGQEYWIVKNSWTVNWGIEGYALVSTKDNMCGIQSNVHYVTIE